MNSRYIYAALSFLAASLMLLSPPANAASLSASYYQVAVGSDQDFGTEPCCFVYGNEVMPTLGPDGLPVLNPLYNATSADPVHDTNTAGEITWWSPAFNANVVPTGTGSILLPYANFAMYPPNATGPNDATAFLTAHYTTTLVVPVAEQVTFNFGADDDAFLYVNGGLVSSLGGVHGNTAAPVATSILAPGNYALDLFYADQLQTGASLTFDITTANVITTTGVPEPASLLLLASSLLGVARLRRKG